MSSNSFALNEFNDYGIKAGAEIANVSQKKLGTDNWKVISAKTDVSASKDWTLKFSDTFSIEDINGIVIQSVKENTFIPVRIKLFPTAREISVSPVSDYIRGEEYVLRLFLSNGNKYRMNFTVKTENDTAADMGNTVGNISNGGYVAEAEGYIYYKKFNDGGKLYRVKANGTGDEKLSDNSANYINVYGGWVYFSSDSGSIYKVRTNGSDELKLNYSLGTSLNVMDNFIYYISDNKEIQKGRLDGSKTEKISGIDGKNLSMNISGENIYYSSEDGDYKLKKITTDGKSFANLLDRRVESVNIIGNWIYFIDRDDLRIYRVDKTGSNLVKLNDQPSKYLNVNGEYIYYTNDVDRSVYRVKVDGSSTPERLNYADSSYINTTSEWIFYMDPTDNVMYRMKLDGSALGKVNF